MPRTDLLKDSFVEAISTAARIWAERWWEGGNNGPPVALAAPAPEPDNDPVLTRVEAARVLKVSPTQITRMRSKGQIKAVERLLPGKVRFRRSDIEKFIDKRR